MPISMPEVCPRCSCSAVAVKSRVIRTTGTSGSASMVAVVMWSVVLGVVLIAATAYVVINLIVDLLYPVLDVRLRDAGNATGTATTAKEAVR